MDTVQSWVDAEEVRRLAEELLAPVLQNEGGKDDVKLEGVADSDLNQDIEEMETSAPMASVIDALAVARKVAEGSGMLQKSTEEEVVEPDLVQVIEKADIREFDPMTILELSNKWAEQFSLRAMVIMTPEAEVIFDTLSNSQLTKMAQKLAESTPPAGNLVVRVGAGTSLQVLSISTVQGELMLGILVSTALSSDDVKRLVDEVSQSMV